MSGEERKPSCSPPRFGEGPGEGFFESLQNRARDLLPNHARLFRSMIQRLARLLGSFNTLAGRRAVRNLAGIGLCTILSQIALLGLIIVTANALGPASFGSFIFALTLQNYLCLIGSAGAQPVVVRDAAAHPERIDEITTTFFAVTSVSSLLVALCAMAGAFAAPLSNDEREVILLFAIANVAASINLSPLFDAQHQQLKGTLGTTIADLLSFAAAFALAQSGSLNLRAIALILATKWIVGTLIQALLYHLTIRRFRIRASARSAFNLAHSSLPILVSYFLCILPLSFGVFFLRFFQGQEATGVYGLACQVGAITFAFAWLGIRIVQPHIGGEYGLHSGFIRKLIVFVVLFLVGLSAAAFAGGTAIIWFAFDPSFRVAIEPMGILIAASAILSAGVVPGLYLLRFHHARRVLLVYFGTAIVYLSGSALLIPEFGIAGAAAMTLVAAVIGTTIMLILASRVVRESRIDRGPLPINGEP